MINKCNICKNKEICKYKDDYEKEFNEVEKLDSNKMFPIILDCNYFHSEVVLTDRGITISPYDYTNGCEGCPTYERIKNGMIGIDDSCSFCTKNKSTRAIWSNCGDTNETISISNVGTSKGVK